MMLVQGMVTSPSTTVAIDSRPISQGIVAADAGGALWAGMGITAFIQQPCGASLQVAETVLEITGFTVLAESSALISSKWEPVPVALENMSINFACLGSGLQLVLKADASLAASLRGAPVTTPLSWSVDEQKVLPYSSSLGQLPIQNFVRTFGGGLVVVSDSEGLCPRWESNASVIIVTL